MAQARATGADTSALAEVGSGGEVAIAFASVTGGATTTNTITISDVPLPSVAFGNGDANPAGGSVAGAVEDGGAAAAAASGLSAAGTFAGDGSSAASAAANLGTAASIADGDSAAAAVARDAGVAVSVAEDGSGSLAVGREGGAAVAMSFADSAAVAVADGDIQLAAAVFSSQASASSGAHDCSGPGLAFAVGSDGGFCVGVGGAFVSG